LDEHHGGHEPERGELRFEVDARLLFELGEQLVARKSVALAELVKNSYDADASEVVVRMENVTRPGGRIVVMDNGSGMTLDQIRQAWMLIATDDKAKSPVSPGFNRRRTGSKGIGRFAARRLAAKLGLQTVAQRADGRWEETAVEFNWDKFSPGQNLNSIPSSYECRIVRPPDGSGLTITLDGARDVWDRAAMKELQRDLLSLTSPIPPPRKSRSLRIKDPGFDFRLEVPEFPEFEGRLTDKFLRNAWGVLKGHVDEKNRAVYKLSSTHADQEHSFRSTSEFPCIPGVQLKVHFIPFRAEFFKGSAFSLGEARDYGREAGGVRIYLDGFRVFPYGDPGDDWLDLDAEKGRRQVTTPTELMAEAGGLKRPMLALPGNMNLFGAVSLGSEQPGIQVNISRERFIENDASRELKKFVRLGINWMTVKYAAHQQAERAAKVEAPSPLSYIRDVRNRLEGAEDLDAETRASVLQALALASDAWEAREHEHIAELSMLRVLASVGTMVVVFDHELRAVVDSLSGIYADLTELVAQVKVEQRPRFQTIISELHRWTESVEQQGAQIGLLLSPAARLRRRQLVVREQAAALKRTFARYIGELGIDLDIASIPSALRTPAMYECEFQSILINLFTNALKAVKRASTRRISISADRQHGSLILRFCDTGCGVDPAVKDQIFEPFVTTSEPDPVLGIGTGLGLKIVRDLVESYGGEIRLGDSTPPWNTCFEMLIPART
jgi:signal transduction histidine kinase